MDAKTSFRIIPYFIADIITAKRSEVKSVSTSTTQNHAIYTHNDNIYTDPTKYFPVNSPAYLCIDLKSFFASVECVERGLDPMTTNLVVADPERSTGTICLAVTPAMKALGVKNRCRVYEIPESIDYITAPPQMQHYIDCAAEIYEVYLQYVSKDDIHVYSIDEAFLDVTRYLSLYQMTAKELGIEIMNAVYDKTGIRATCGIGTNLYLTKIALDITAKHSPDFIGILTEDTYKATLWNHKPLTDFWRIGTGTAKRLAQYGITTMGELARTAAANEETLYRLFGIDAEILIDHAFGREPVTMKDIKNYKSKTNCLSSGQVLLRDYSFSEGELIAKEMMNELCLELTDKELVTDSVTLHVSYSHSWRDSLGYPAESSHGTITSEMTTSADIIWLPKIKQLYERIVKRNVPVRRINITCNRVISGSNNSPCYQYSLFGINGEISADIEQTVMMQERNQRLQDAVLHIKQRYGKNAILKGMNLEEAATGRERNRQIGGHKSGA